MRLKPSPIDEAMAECVHSYIGQNVGIFDLESDERERDFVKIYGCIVFVFAISVDNQF